MAKRGLRGGHRDPKVGRGKVFHSDHIANYEVASSTVSYVRRKMSKLIIDFPLGDTNSWRQVDGSGFGLQSEDQEINAHLPERFRWSAHSFSANSRLSPSSTPNIKLNVGIRAYARAADDIMKTSPSRWLCQPEVPTSAEVLIAGDDDVTLPANKIDGAWKSKDKYLKAHYSLLREDAVSPLRDAVEHFRRTPDMMENETKVVSIYEKVYIAGFTFAPLGIAARIRFSTTRAGKAIPWRYSKRLIAGSIVALTPAKDKFKTTCIIAVVAARPIAGVEDTPPQIDIYFSRAEEIEVDPQLEWTMVEAKQGYFEAARHTLRALQKLSHESFPLSQEICTLSTAIEPPLYVSSYPSIDLRAAFYGNNREFSMKDVNILEDWPSAPEENLDITQWAAMQQILTKRLAIIQGPPGTGKTYVSKMALQILIENKKEGDPPIIVAAQTNHALDQLLGHIARFDPEYIRLGGQSNKPEVKKRALYEVRQRERLPILPGGLLGKAKKQMDTLARQMRETLSPLDRSHTRGPFSAKTLYELGVLNQAQATSLEAGAAGWVTSSNSESENEVALWLNKALLPFQIAYKQDNFGFSEEEVDLEYEQITELQAEMGVTDDEDIEYLRGAWCTVEDNFTVAKPSGTILRIARQTLSNVTDMWKIKESLRGPIYSILQAAAKAEIVTKFRGQAKTYDILVRDLKIGKWERDAQYLERTNIIGMTTTGLSKYRPLISSLKPKIILIEEAAEVIEAPVTAACVESLEHLILVGDHQQLQGHCNVQELGVEPYNLNVSMFERLVRNNMPFKTLLRQRRMDPEFRRLLRPLYPQLQDHPDVVGRPPLPVGLGSLKSFFFDHEYPEHKDDQLSSFNDREAEFIAGFYHYLLQNSANPEGITILTFYNGQRKRILSHLKSRPQIAHHYTNVVTVDSYQGEENGIIILSLVRNNEHGDIGFLKVDNRVCVALSRAQHGFYIFGNSKLLAASSPLWSKVIEILGDSPNCISDKFPIVCKNHGRQTLIAYPGDWGTCDGGCDLKCSESLPCGHPCPLKCHSYPHDTMTCQQPCGKVLFCGHKCAEACFEKPCLCSCQQFSKSIRASPEEPPDAGESSDNKQAALGAGDTKNAWAKTTSVAGDHCGRPSHNKEVRGNNSQYREGALPPPSQSYSSPPQASQNVSYGNGIATRHSISLVMKDLSTQSGVSPVRHSPTLSDNSLCTQPTSSDFALGFGKGTQQSSEKQIQIVAHWTNFAAGGVKKDDSQREKLAAAEANSALQQRLSEASLIEFEDANESDGKQYSGTVKGETVVEMRNGRKKWLEEYQPSYNAKPGFGYSATPSIRSSESAQSSGRQSLVDLLD